MHNPSHASHSGLSRRATLRVLVAVGGGAAVLAATQSRALLAGASALRPPSGATAPGPRLVATYTQGNIPLGATQNSVAPGSMANDRGFYVGGIGSGLFHKTSSAPQFLMVADRGPNDVIRVGTQNRRTTLLPEYSPMIYHVTARDGALNLDKVTPIRTASGALVGGAVNIPGYDETLYDVTAQNVMPYSPNGLDPEGIVEARGDYWLVDEYSPSIVRVDKQSGKVLARFVPSTLPLVGADYPVINNLPAIYRKRKAARGFEGIGITPDQRYLFALLQSPLLNPTTAVGNASRNTRLIKFDMKTQMPVAEYCYRFEVVDTFDPLNAGKPAEMKLSGVVALSETRLVVLERTDNRAKLYLADVSGATNLLGSVWNNPATSPTLESLTNLGAAGVSAATKELVVDFGLLAGVPGKLEGVAVLDAETVAVSNDNDFGFGGLDSHGNNIYNGVANAIYVVRLGVRLPM